jgi:uncharacterized protein
MWIPRLYEGEVADAVKQRPAVLLTGARQTGKSSLLKVVFPQYEYVTLDRMLLAREAQENPEAFLRRFSGPVIIDEIQYAPNLFRELKIRIDEDRHEKGRWILTGSQQYGLMQNVTESLAGRIRVLRLYSLSMSEIHQSGFFTESQSKAYLWKGGYPELWAEPDLNPWDFYDDYIQTYLERDLRNILKVRDLRDFQRLIQVCALRSGQLVNYSEMARDLGVTVNTIKAWLSALEAGNLISFLTPFFGNIGKRLSKASKLYFTDHGLLCHLLQIRSEMDYLDHPLKGAVWETLTHSELIKSGFRPGKDLFYYRDQNGVEIDFLLNKNREIELIEAKASEQPDLSRLNFTKVATLFKKKKVTCKVACPALTSVDLGRYQIYNPLKNH